VAAESASFDEALGALGQLLEERGLRYELLAIGGGALQLLGLITRSTKDIDIVAMVEDGDPTPIAALPGPLQEAVEDTAGVLRLPLDWFNAGPRALLDLGLTIEELRAAAAWARSHDPSVAFATELRRALLDLGGPDAIG
jgi:hypothetical protein